MVPPVVTRDNSPTPTRQHVLTIAGTPLLDQDDSQQPWLSKVDSIISKVVVIYKNISWLAHFASLQDSALRPPAITALLPLFKIR